MGRRGPQGLFAPTSKKTLNTSSDCLEVPLTRPKQLYVLGQVPYETRVSMANQGMIRKFKTNSTCPQPVFLVLRHVGYINSHDEHVRVLDASTYSKASFAPQPIHRSFTGWSPVFSRPIKYDWVEKGRSFESSSGNAWCCIGCKPTSDSGWIRHLGERIGSVLPKWWDY